VSSQPPAEGSYRADPESVLWPLLGGIVMLAVPAYSALEPPRAAARDLLVLLSIAVLPVFAIVWAVCTWVRFRLAWDTRSIHVVTAFGRRTVPVDAVVGRRFRSYGKGRPDEDVLELREGHGRRLRIPRAFAVDAAYERWLAQFPDLTELEYRRANAAFADDPAIAPSSAERRASIVRARYAGRVLTALALLVSLGAPAAGDSRHAAHMVAAALPWLALLLVAVRPALWTLVTTLRDGRIGLGAAFVVPAAALALAGARADLPDWRATLAIAAATFAAAALVDRGVRRPGVGTLIAASSLAYGFGVVATLL
jgi:hypothetical protein